MPQRDDVELVYDLRIKTIELLPDRSYGITVALYDKRFPDGDIFEMRCQTPPGEVCSFDQAAVMGVLNVIVNLKDQLLPLLDDVVGSPTRLAEIIGLPERYVQAAAEEWATLVGSKEGNSN